ncbi:MAG: hypothetical protein H6Q51_1473 [Deltaproteobacteria bacterium]|nr:hypothetical protein [Deltaproteobacteria bacterium]
MKQAVFTVLLALCLVMTPAFTSAQDQSALSNSLSYLFDVSQVAWVVYDQNRAYLGFATVSPDVEQIVRTAASIGSKAYGGEVQVWGVGFQYGGWRPGTGLPYICTTVADRGEVTSSSCPGLQQ